MIATAIKAGGSPHGTFRLNFQEIGEKILLSPRGLGPGLPAVHVRGTRSVNLDDGYRDRSLNSEETRAAADVTSGM